MRLGVIFPQTEIGADPGVIREYAQTVEGLGYQHLSVYDHVLGANPASRPGWQGAYTHREMFHEPFVLFGYLAAVAPRLELVTEILVLPQRQTALVAKQAAEVDVLTGGRLRLGVGIGWNAVEFEALGEDFHTRGRRVEEQVRVLRALWTNELVTLKGRWHTITDAGINPLPVQRPIPVWMGGSADAALRRIARIADGWFPREGPTEKGKARIEAFRTYAREAGRDPAAIGVEGRISVARRTPDEWMAEAQAWRALGATHIAVNTMGAGFRSVRDHLNALRQFKEAATPLV